MNTRNTMSKSRRMLLNQQAKEWDSLADIDWFTLSTETPLLPDCEGLARELGLSSPETVAVSQALGLMAAQAISQHERILGTVKDACWRTPLKSLTNRDDFIELGEHFFKEEAKHARTFSRYIDLFANRLQISMLHLAQILPTYRQNSGFPHLFKWISRIGGRSLWWLVMITEEESLHLFRTMRAHKNKLDPLYYRIHELHFEEEIRHSSYAPTMLRHLAEHGGFFRRLVMRCDYHFAVALHITWIVTQLFRMRHLKTLQNEHPFFHLLYSALQKFRNLPLKRQIHLLASDFPYVSDLLTPSRHRSIRIERQRSLEYTGVKR